jgi:hypothetical protein
MNDPKWFLFFSELWWLFILVLSGIIIGWNLSDWIHKSFVDDYTMSSWQLLKRKINSSITGGLIPVFIYLFVQFLIAISNEQNSSNNSSAISDKQIEQNSSDNSSAISDKQNNY